MGAGVVGLGLYGAVGGNTNPAQSSKPRQDKSQGRQEINDLMAQYNATYGTSLGQPKPRISHTPIGLGNIAGIESPTQLTHSGNTSVTKTPMGAKLGE